MFNDHSSVSIDETPDENIFETMQRVQNNNSMLTKSIQAIEREKRELDEVSNQIIDFTLRFGLYWSGVHIV